MNKSVKMILGSTLNSVIGKNNHLVVLSAVDLAFFKEMTSNSTVIMGKNTWYSLPAKLQNRVNIVISKDSTLSQCNPGPDHVYSSLDDAINSADGSVWLIGGSGIYNDGINKCSELYLTLWDFDEEIDDDSVVLSDHFKETLETKFTKKVHSLIDDRGMTGVIYKYTRKPAPMAFIY